MEADWCSSADLHFITTPFHSIYTKTIQIKKKQITTKKKCFGFILDTDEFNERVFMSQILPRSDAFQYICSSKTSTFDDIGAYIIAINKTLVKIEAINKFVKIQEDNFSFTISLTSPRKLPATNRDQELIELDLTALLFTVHSPYFYTDDNDINHIASLSLEDI